jgi:peptidoglycan/LPS O-acetylase OafA/YrhL
VLNGLDGDRVTAAAPAVNAERPDGTVVFIQYLRGIAPLLVVWAHLSGFWLFAHHRTWRVQTDWAYYLAAPLGLYQNAGHLGVVLFFFVSGYIVSMASSRETVPTYTIRRVFRLAPALWLALLVVALSRYIDHSVTHSYPIGTGGGTVTSYVGAGFFADMIGGTTQINAVTWTLVVEVMFYLLIGASIPLSRRRPALSTVAMVLAWAALALAFNHFSSTRQLDAFTVYGWVLFLGRAFYLTHRKLVSPRVGLALSAMIMVVGVAVYQHCVPGLLQMAGGPANSYLLGALIFLAFMFAAPRRTPWPVRKLSEVSYSLYLLHIPVGIPRDRPRDPRRRIVLVGLLPRVRRVTARRHAQLPRHREAGPAPRASTGERSPQTFRGSRGSEQHRLTARAAHQRGAGSDPAGRRFGLTHAW